MNSEQAVEDRARECQQQRGHIANFVAVDFATIGQAMAAVNRLNGV